MKKSLLALTVLTLAVQAPAAIIPFDLIGIAGAGLLTANEPGSLVGGTGGEILGGITYDNDPLQRKLTINVGWGSGNGAFTDLSSNVTNQHVHGPVANNFGFNGTANFTQTSGTTILLTRTSNSPVNGQIVNNVLTFTAAQEADLFNGKFYINVHTANNTGGEIRGFLIPVPEPSTAVLASFGLAGWLGRRRRASR